MTAERRDLLLGEREERHCRGLDRSGALKQRNLPGSWSVVEISVLQLTGINLRRNLDKMVITNNNNPIIALKE